MSEESQKKTQNENEDKSPGFFSCKKRDRGASEERLIAAGLEIFSKFGFNGATTKMIAKKADVNESLIGRYFDGKEGLLLAITKKFVAEINSVELQYPPQATLAEELTKYLEERIVSGCQFEDFAKLIISQALVDKKFKKRARETVTLMIDPKLISRVQKLSDDGKLVAGSNVLEICDDIETYMDGIFFFGRIMHEEPIEDLLKKSVRFVKTYAKLFDK